MNEAKLWSAELSVLLRDDQERLLRTAGFDAYDRHTSDLLTVVAQAART